jgi:mannose-6-phosphate isomerase-like protein (cupin superfamily)
MRHGFGSGFFASAAVISLLASTAALAQGTGAAGHVPLDERIAHADPARCIPGKPGCLKVTRVVGQHNGDGMADYGPLFDPPRGGRPNDTAKFNLGAPLGFLHRGVLYPGSSFGQHFHTNAEEMFMILDGEAQFTIDGRTSVLKGPAGAPDRLGHSHAIYNASDKPVQMMNINIQAEGPIGQGFTNLNDDHKNPVLDRVPQFIHMDLDPSLLQPVQNKEGGKGTVMYNRSLGPSVFSTAWSYVDHLVLPPGTSVGPVSKPGMSEIYYVLSGEGTATISGETAKIYKDDAVPAAIDESRAFANTGSAPLDFMVFGIAKDLAAKRAYVASSPGFAGAAPAQGRGGNVASSANPSASAGNPEIIQTAFQETLHRRATADEVNNVLAAWENSGRTLSFEAFVRAVLKNAPTKDFEYTRLGQGAASRSCWIAPGQQCTEAALRGASN